MPIKLAKTKFFFASEEKSFVITFDYMKDNTEAPGNAEAHAHNMPELFKPSHCNNWLIDPACSGSSPTPLNGLCNQSRLSSEMTRPVANYS